MLRRVLTLVWITVAGLATVWGLEYYLTPLPERPFAAGHALFAPSGLVGHGYGVVGTAFMGVGVAAYGIRKRVRWMARWGRLKHWLQVHIFLCTLGPYLVVLHSSLRVGGLVAISFWSMVIVVVSGVFGRYLYVHIPKTLDGVFLSPEAVEERRDRVLAALRRQGFEDATLLRQVSARLRPPEARSLLHAFVLGVRWDLGRGGREREIRALLAGEGAQGTAYRKIDALVHREVRLSGQAALLEPFRRLFRYWHVIHLPLALVMFLILGVHVTVAFLFGYGWVF